MLGLRIRDISCASIVCLLMVLLPLCADIIVWRANQFYVLTNEHVGIRLMSPGVGQFLVTFLLWLLVSVLIFSEFSHRASARQKIFISLAIIWLAWLTWLWSAAMYKFEDLSQPIVFLLIIFSAISVKIFSASIRPDVRPCIYGVIVLAFIAGATDCIWSDFGKAIRWRGLWINANTFGGFFSLAAWWCLHDYATRMKQGPNVGMAGNRRTWGCWVFSFILITASFLGVLFSQSRTAAWSIFLICVCILLFKWPGKLKALTLAAGLSALGVTSIVSSNSVVSGYSRLINAPDSMDKSITNRLKCWEAVFEIGVTKPVAGVGWEYMDLLYGAFRPAGLNDIRAGWLNNFTQVFATRGIIGALGLALILVVAIYGNWRESDRWTKFAFGALFFLLVTQMIFNDVLFSPALGLLFWLYIMHAMSRPPEDISSAL